MSLHLNEDEVSAVLLADGWHYVARYPRDSVEAGKSTFCTDAYEFFQGNGKDAIATLRGGAVPLIPSIGFTFQEQDGGWIAGPLTSVLAISYPL